MTLSPRLHDNRLLHLPDDIPCLTLLREARLYNNQIAAVFSRPFPAAPTVFGSVRVLRMVNNHVTSPLLNTIASGCPLIEELALSHNRISLLHAAVCSLSKLQRLLLHSNRICHIAAEVLNLSSLHTLILTGWGFGVVLLGVWGCVARGCSAVTWWRTARGRS